MLKIQQVKRLALQNAQGSRAEGGSASGRRQSWGAPFIGRRSVWRSGGGLGGAHVSTGVAFGALEDSSEGLDLCEDEELSLGKILAYDCL